MTDRIGASDSRTLGVYVVQNTTLEAIGTTIGVYGIAVYNVLASIAGQGAECFPKVADIAAMIGAGERKVRDTLAELEAGGFIAIQHRRTEGRPSIYTLKQAPAPHAGAPRHGMPEAPARHAEHYDVDVYDVKNTNHNMAAAPQTAPKSDTHFAAVAAMCGMDSRHISGGNRIQIGKLAKALKTEGVTVEFVEACAETWYSAKWGWKPRSEVRPPSVAQAGEWIGMEAKRVAEGSAARPAMRF